MTFIELQEVMGLFCAIKAVDALPDRWMRAREICRAALVAEYCGIPGDVRQEIEGGGCKPKEVWE